MNGLCFGIDYSLSKDMIVLSIYMDKVTHRHKIIAQDIVMSSLPWAPLLTGWRRLVDDVIAAYPQSTKIILQNYLEFLRFNLIHATSYDLPSAIQEEIVCIKQNIEDFDLPE